MVDPAISYFPWSWCDDRLWSVDRKSKEFSLGSGGTVWYLCRIPACDCTWLQWKSSSSDLNHRWSRWSYLHFPCRKTGSDRSDGIDCRGSIFVYVTGADHPATDHETPYNKEGTRDQDGTASSGFQTGTNPFPNHCYDCGMFDPSKYSTSHRYVDAW